MNYSGAASSRLGSGGASRSKDVSGGGRDSSGHRSMSYNDLSDLVSSSYGKNWRGVVIALLVIATICSFIGLAIILVTPDRIDERPLEMFTFDDLFDADLQPRHVAVQWSAGGNSFMLLDREGNLVERNAETNQSASIISNETLAAVGAEKWAVSPDSRYVLLATKVNQVRSRTMEASYIIYDRESHNAQFIPVPYKSSVDESQTQRLQYAGWTSPNGHLLSFVLNNNVFIQQSPSTDPVQMTFYGQSDRVYCGLPDWLYEDEILRSDVAHWVSPTKQYIAFVCFNVTNVPIHRLPVYGSSASLYSTVSDIRYPKAGDDRQHILPVAELFVIRTNAPSMEPHRIQPPAALTNREHFITLVEWLSDDRMLIAWSNRRQNSTWLTVCPAAVVTSTLKTTDQGCHMILHETTLQGGSGWLTINEVFSLDDGRRFLLVLPETDGATGPWKHVALITISEDGLSATKIFLTHGSIEVTEIVGYSPENSTMYYLATNGRAMKQHLYSARLHSRKDASNDRAPAVVKQTAHQDPHCMSCSLDGSTSCEYVTAHFSRTARHYVIGCLGPQMPSYHLRSTTNDSADVLLEPNADQAARLAGKALSKKEYFCFKNTDGYDEEHVQENVECELCGQLHLPPVLNRAHITRYPLLVHTHAEPGTQLVSELFAVDWTTYLSSTENVIVVSVDSRGSAGRGDRFLNQVHRRPGSVEVQDQISAARFLKTKYSFIDDENVAIWGSSYGGFVTLHSLGEEDDNTFRCGIAVSPITDWKYYDIVSSERLLGLPTGSDNFRGYDSANVLAKAANMKNKQLLLIHSMSDDKVHFQHSAHLMKALTITGIDYSVRLYSDVPHTALPSALERLIGPSLPPSVLSSASRRAPPYVETTSGLERVRYRWMEVRRHAYRTMLAFLKNNCWNSTSISFQTSLRLGGHHQLDRRTSDGLFPSSSSNVANIVGGHPVANSDGDPLQTDRAPAHVMSHVIPVAAGISESDQTELGLSQDAKTKP